MNDTLNTITYVNSLSAEIFKCVGTMFVTVTIICGSILVIVATYRMIKSILNPE